MARYGNPNAFTSPYAEPMEKFAGGLNTIAQAVVRNMQSPEEIEAAALLNDSRRASASLTRAKTGEIALRQDRDREARARLATMPPDDPQRKALEQSIMLSDAATGDSNADQLANAALKVNQLDARGRVEAKPEIAGAVAAAMGAADGKQQIDIKGDTIFNPYSGAVAGPTAVGESRINTNNAQARLRDAQGYTEQNETRELKRAQARAAGELADVRDRTDPNARKGGAGAGRDKSMTEATRLKYEADDEETLAAREQLDELKRDPKAFRRLQSADPAELNRLRAKAGRGLKMPENRAKFNEGAAPAPGAKPPVATATPAPGAKAAPAKVRSKEEVDKAIAAANRAIQGGADPTAVKQRLEAMGIILNAPAKK